MDDERKASDSLRSNDKTMGIASSVNIRLEDGKFSNLISVLLSAGWDFFSETIIYQHYTDFGDYGEWKTTSSADQYRLLAELDQRSSHGEYVTIGLYWQSNAEHIEVQWWLDEGITIFFDGTRRTLECASQFTDFSWVLQRTLCPFVNSGCNILGVTCIDEY